MTSVEVPTERRHPAVLVVDLRTGAVLHANPQALALAGDLRLPAGISQWSRRAGLRDHLGQELHADAGSLAGLEDGQPLGELPAGPGEVVLRVIGFRLEDVVALQGLMLLVCLTPEPADALQDQAALRERALVATDVSFTISDATLPDHPLIWVSDAFVRTTGYAVEEAIGRNCRFLQGSDTDREAVEQVRGAVAAQRKITITLLNYRRDGSPFWNELSLAPVFDDQGTLRNYVGSRPTSPCGCSWSRSARRPTPVSGRHERRPRRPGARRTPTANACGS